MVADGSVFCGQCGEQVDDPAVLVPDPIGSPDLPLVVELVAFKVEASADEFGIVTWALELRLVFENRSDKPIRAFTGTLVITDLFGKIKVSAGLTVDRPTLQPGVSHQTDEYSVGLNEYIDDQMWLLDRGMTDVEWTFLHEGVIFADGSRWAP